jgi:hypothetical protein
MSKKLDTTSITSELEGSAFFPLNRVPGVRESIVRPTRTAARGEKTEKITQPASAEAPARERKVVKETTTSTIGTRPYVRRTFDIFEDQLSYLNRASLEDRLAGGEGSMNSMVRAALDAYIQKHKER